VREGVDVAPSPTAPPTARPRIGAKPRSIKTKIDSPDRFK
jgi:hypothetical protein